MAGTLISVVSKTAYSLTFASGSSQTVTLNPKPFDVRDAVSGVLVVRVAAATAPAGGTYTVTVADAVIMPDDPATIYTIPSSTVMSITINPNADGPFPRLYLASFTASSSPPCGPMLGVGMYNTYGSAAGSGSITMGVELLIRDT